MTVSRKEEIIQELTSLYESMPQTTCHKTSCANWCCTKLENSMDPEGNFMPLPLVYSVEYLNILQYLEKQYSHREIGRHFNFSRSHRICPFKDPTSHRCGIYPVRPFSCRVYGRKVPPVFWGMSVTEEQAASIHCTDMSVTEEEKVEAFNQAYPKIWSQLAVLSQECYPFSPAQGREIQKHSGGSSILVLAFGEFYNLSSKSLKWFREEFQRYWEKMGNLL